MGERAHNDLGTNGAGAVGVAAHGVGDADVPLTAPAGLPVDPDVASASASL